MKKIYRMLVFALTVFIVSCTSEPEVDLTKVHYFPKVDYTGKTELNQIIDIKAQQLSKNSRINETLDFDQAITARYVGSDDFDFVYIPSKLSSNEFYLYSFKDDKLNSLSLKIKNLENTLIVTSEAGEIVVELEKNFIKTMNVASVDTNHNSAIGAKECSPAKDFMAFEGAVQQQLVDKVGSWGALAVDIGCSLWVVCRGAVVAAGVIYAASQCV